MLTRAISRTTPQKRKRIQERQGSGEISRLLSAAVINKRFRELLLSDPARAMSQGFCGEEFSFDLDQEALLLAIRADSLKDFAFQISSALEPEPVGCSAEWIPINQPTFVMHAK